ncbi:MAG: histidine kinase N-terminal 7TM domain-containing protein, partial [Acidobacteriota bacterium]
MHVLYYLEVRDSILILALLSFLVTGMYLALGVYILRSNRRAALNRLFFLICLSLAVWSLAYTFLPSAATKEQAWSWFRLSAIGWTLSPALVFHFCLLLSKRSKPGESKSALLMIYLAAAYFLLRALGGELRFADFVQTRFGWAQVYDRLTFEFVAFAVYALAAVLWGLGLVFNQGRRAARTVERRQAQFVSLSGLPVLVAVAVFAIVLPWLEIRN